MRADLTRIQVQAVVAHLRDMLGEEPDEQLLLDSLEGETDLYELVRKLLGEIEADEGTAAILTSQIEDRQLRKKRAEDRVKTHRSGIMALMECAQLDKLTLPEATISVRSVPPKPIVTDEASLPDEFCKFTRRPDMAAIKAGVEAGAAVPGISFDNGGQSLTIRKK